MSAIVPYLIQTMVPRPVSYFHSNFDGLNLTVLPDELPGASVSRICSSVAEKASGKGLTAEIVYSCTDHSVQGVILPDRSAGVCGAALVPRGSPGDPEIEEAWEEAREKYRRALALHDQQEAIYIANMDFTAADLLAERMALTLFKATASGSGAQRKDRFFGASSAEGSINHLTALTAAIPRRVFIKGRPGTGKSTFLKKIAAVSLARNFPTEIYHCSFAPDSLDLVIVREAGVCLFDSTAPHEIFPSRPGDETLDLFLACVKAGTEEKYRSELTALQDRYQTALAEARPFLRKVRELYARADAALPPLRAAVEKERTEQVLSRLF